MQARNGQQVADPGGGEGVCERLAGEQALERGETEIGGQFACNELQLGEGRIPRAEVELERTRLRTVADGAGDQAGPLQLGSLPLLGENCLPEV